MIYRGSRTVSRTALVVVIGVLLLAALPVLPYGAAASTSGSRTAPAVPAPLTPAATPSPATPRPATPHPQVTCGPGYPAYGKLAGNVWPLSPNFYLQTPCAPVAQDEIHASLGSSVNGSGSRWTMPWYLPPESANGQENATAGVYLGMVVSGDAHSAYNQSYLELQATPIELTSGFNWNLSVAVLSFANASKYSTGCSVGINLSWNDSYWCEWDDLGSGSSISLLQVHGGSWIQATFVGTPGRGATTLFVNQTRGGNATANVTLDQSRTGTFSFAPAYSAACVNTCELDWASSPSSGSGQPYGLGIGVNICPEGVAPYSYCDSYNGSRWLTLAPMEFGIPEYWTGSGYTGTYASFAPESTSGVCNTSPALGEILATCNQFSSAGGDGTYPYFTLAGNNSASYLTFGLSYPATRTSWGGAYGQFLSSSGAQDLLPFAITHTSDSSDGGYVPTAGELNVTARATALGSVSSVSLTYDVGGGSWTTVSMGSTGGTTEDGTYLATVPSGPNGKIAYYVNATDAAGSDVSIGPRTVLRGPLPHFQIDVGIAPPSCGSVVLNGSSEPNGSVVSLEPGTYSLAATGCANYTFVGWQATPTLSLAGSGPAATVTVTGNGTLTAVWRYVRPYVTLSIVVSPSACGTVSVNGTNYTSGDSLLLPYDLSVHIAQSVTCAGDVFSGWSVAGNLTILGDNLVPGGNGTLSAGYVASAGAFAVTFGTVPSTCGGIDLSGVGYADGETIYLPSGTYAIAPDPCAHFGFSGYSTTGGASVSGSTLTVSGAGTVTENNYKLTELFVVTAPSACGGFVLNGTEYVNGADVVLQNHTVYSVSAYSCGGHYLESVTASGGLTLIGSLLSVNGTGTILVVSLAGTPHVYVGILTHPSTCGAVILGGNTFGNGGFTTESPGAVLAIQPLACADYGFIGFIASGGIQIVGSTAWVNNSGAIEVYFGPLVPLLIYTTPATCGTVGIAGISYADGSEATLVSGVTYQLTATGCPHYSLVGFESAPYVTIANGTITPTGGTTVTAVFAPQIYSVPLEVAGPGCGAITVNGAVEPAGARLHGPVASYPLGEVPCATSVFAGWNLTGNVTLAGSTLVVDGNGTVIARFVPAPLTVTIGGPALGYVGVSVTWIAELPYVLSSTGYSYLWSFGDGASATSTTSNGTSHAYARPGTYTLSVQVVDPLHRSANATWSVTVVGAGGGSTPVVYSYVVLAVGAAAVALVLGYLFARRPGSAARVAPPEAQPVGAPAPVPRLPPGPG